MRGQFLLDGSKYLEHFRERYRYFQKERSERLEKAKEEFDSGFIITKAMEMQKDKFRSELYPDSSSAFDSVTFSARLTSLRSARDELIQDWFAYDDELVAESQRMIDEQLQSAAISGQLRALKWAEDVYERLSKAKEETKVTSTIVEVADSLADYLESYNPMGNPELEELSKKLRSFSMTDLERVRADMYGERADAASKVKDILDRIQSMKLA